MQNLSLVFIANTGRNDKSLPQYLLDALNRFQIEQAGADNPRYFLVTHDLKIGPGEVSSERLGMRGQGRSTQYALLDLLDKINPGPY